MKIRILSLILLTSLFYGCAASRSASDEPAGMVSLTGTVLKAKGAEAEIAAKLPEPPETASQVGGLAHKVINKTVFLEGGRTEIDGTPVVIRRVSKNILAVKAEKEASFAAGSTVSIAIPKKLVAVVDFEVINNPQSDMGRILLESLTNELVDSGQFVVLERSKLKSVLEEIKLSQSGLTQETAEPMTEKLVSADLLLTGTLAQSGPEWMVNLRLVNVRTGQAIAAISDTMPILRPADRRDVSALSEGFEGETFPGWNLGRHGSGKEAFQVRIDRSSGAEQSTSSVRVDFPKEPQMENFVNVTSLTKRDLSRYKGVEFYVKGSNDMGGVFQVLTSLPEAPNRIDNFLAGFRVTPQWAKVRVPFDSLVVNRRWIKKGAGNFGVEVGDQLLRLNLVEMVRIGVKGDEAVPEATIWVDNVSFYK